MLGLHPFPHICNRSQEPSRIQLSAESQHLKGQLDPSVGNGHVFASKEVSWILLLVNVPEMLVNVPEMQKRSFRNTKVQLHKSFNSVVQPDSVQLLPLT